MTTSHVNWASPMQKCDLRPADVSYLPKLAWSSFWKRFVGRKIREDNLTNFHEAVHRSERPNEKACVQFSEIGRRVRDVMSPAVISVAADTPVQEIAATLTKHRISSVPVISKMGRLIGIVSEGDLIRRAELGTEPRRAWWQAIVTDAVASAHGYIRSHGRTARDVMTVDVVTATPDELLCKLSVRMTRKRVRRVPVVYDGRVIGVIAQSDLVRQLARHKPSERSLSDEALRMEIVEQIRRLPWNLRIRFVNIEVEGGVATLYGWATSAIEKRAFEVVAENTGAVAVRNCVQPALPYV